MALDEADVSGEVVRIYWMAFVDIDGQPVRASTLPFAITPSGTGDADLDGQTFLALDHKLVDVSPVVHGRGGSDTVQVRLRGLPVIDVDLIAALDDPDKWQGREARLWHGIFDPVAGTFGAPRPYYTGVITKLLDDIQPATEDEVASRTISLDVENYLTLLTAPRNRTYQDQAEHDAGDLSATRIRASANGTVGSGIPFGGGGGGASGGYSERLLADLP